MKINGWNSEQWLEYAERMERKFHTSVGEARAAARREMQYALHTAIKLEEQK